MKKFLKIKWEIIITIAAFIFFTYAMIDHQINNGFNFTNLLFEMAFYYSMVIVSNYALYSARKELLK